MKIGIFKSFQLETEIDHNISTEDGHSHTYMATSRQRKN